MQPIEATCTYVPAHFNRTCRANIPAYASAVVVLDETDHGFSQVEGGYTGCDLSPAEARRAALSDLVSKLKERGLTGTLKVRHI